MMAIRHRVIALAALSLTLAGCGRGQAHLAEPAPPSGVEFASVLTRAAQEAGAGRYAMADRMLAEYSTRFPASGEAPESMYWRALFKLDPSNQGGSTREATQLLDGYLASVVIAHRPEALTLKRIATAMEARAAATAPTAVRVEPAPVDKSKDEEIAKLKEELSKANAELERIKRRLAQPTKP